MEEARIRSMSEQMIRENPKSRIIDFTLEGQKYWIKRKLGNGRNQLVKYSVEKEFYYEIARMTIAGESHPELVPNIQVLTPDYMVTLDGGPTLKNILGSKRREEEKKDILGETGAALAALHHDGVIHGRPALRDITYKDGKLTFLDWENRLYSRNREEQKAIDFLLLLQGICRENYREEKGRVLAAADGRRARPSGRRSACGGPRAAGPPSSGSSCRRCRARHWRRPRNPRPTRRRSLSRR